MVTHDDDLEQNPEWDAKALRLVETIERAILRLRLESQCELVAIINAIEVQLESKYTVPEVLRLLVESLRPSPVPERSNNITRLASINS